MTAYRDGLALPFNTWVIFGVAGDAEDAVGAFGARWREGEWVVVLPDGLFFWSDFEEKSVGAVANERVTVGQSLGAGNEG